MTNPLATLLSQLMTLVVAALTLLALAWAVNTATNWHYDRPITAARAR